MLNHIKLSQKQISLRAQSKATKPRTKDGVIEPTHWWHRRNEDKDMGSNRQLGIKDDIKDAITLVTAEMSEGGGREGVELRAKHSDHPHVMSERQLDIVAWYHWLVRTKMWRTITTGVPPRTLAFIPCP
jgi:hypothetical protein